MSAALPPHLVAELDQESAAVNAGLDEILDETRQMLATGLDSDVAAQIMAAAFAGVPGGPLRACTALGYALVRLARQDGGRS